MDAMELLDRSAPIKPAPLFAVMGDEDFLRRQALHRLITDLLGDADPAFALTTFEGDSAQWSVVKSELDTLPFLSPRRVVLIEQADQFVSNVRTTLEKFVAGPTSPGTLILSVKSWPSNTKLAKATPDAATIVCKALKPQQLVPWCRKWAKERYDKNLEDEAAQWLIELAGPGLGQLDQEIAKLATNDGKSITREQVETIVGRSRQAETFKIFDAIGNGRVGDALNILQRLLTEGEEPLAILGAFSWQLRRLAAVSRLARSGLSFDAACQRAGVPPFAIRQIEQQLRHLGRTRMNKIYDWLLETDLGMKGSNPLPQRLIMERLVVQLARTDKAVAV